MADWNQQTEIAGLRLRLEEAEDTIRAIRSGAVDAFVVEVPNGPQVYTLQTADRPYRVLVEEMQQGALTLGNDGTIIYSNRRFAELVGKSLEALIGVAFRDFIPPDAQSVYQDLLQQGRAGFSQGESHLHNADGALVPVFLTLNALPPPSGAAVGLLVTDLTTQRHHEKMNTLVEALKEADRRKDEFLAMLGHELRSPLVPIRNALRIIQMPEADVAFVQSAPAMMERQVAQMVRLVDDLLDLSRISRGTIQLRRVRIELASVVHDAVESALSVVHFMEHELTVTLPPQPICLEADPVRLAQLIGNLLNNACKFTGKKGRIWLAVEQEGEQATIRVRDNGIGIAADQLPKIFEMFMQVDTSLERTVSGLGIGLMLVKNLAELHGGTVEVHSAGIGHGTEFLVRLPSTSATYQPSLPEPDVFSPTDVTPLRILVVDDNKDSASTLSMLLGLDGNQTRAAYDGLEAVQAAEQFRPHVILLDIGLPGISGHEACRRIRAQPWGKTMVIVALTGWGQEEDRQKSNDAGFNAHMVKPVDRGVINQLLAELLPSPVSSR